MSLNSVLRPAFSNIMHRVPYNSSYFQQPMNIPVGSPVASFNITPRLQTPVTNASSQVTNQQPFDMVHLVGKINNLGVSTTQVRCLLNLLKLKLAVKINKFVHRS